MLIGIGVTNMGTTGTKASSPPKHGRNTTGSLDGLPVVFLNFEIPLEAPALFVGLKFRLMLTTVYSFAIRMFSCWRVM